jgi:hypothetical protein
MLEGHADVEINSVPERACIEAALVEPSSAICSIASTPKSRIGAWQKTMTWPLTCSASRSASAWAIPSSARTEIRTRLGLLGRC